MSSPLNLTSFNIGSYELVGGSSATTSTRKGVKSLLNKSTFYYKPTTNGAVAIGTAINGLGTSAGDNSRFGSDDDIYNTSLTSIINYTSKYSAMRLKASDFAYLKNIGVYPNNRLMVARRFQSAVDSNLTKYKSKPSISNMITWVPPTDANFFNISFGEKWEDAGASLSEILNSALAEFGIDKDTGEGGNLTQLKGFTSGLQRSLMEKLGLTDTGAESMPAGNPNLIRAAKMRSVLGDDKKAGSGLNCSISIKMEVEWEQKFINGNDPTLAFLDIINLALRFGSSKSDFVLSGKLAEKALEAGSFLDLLRRNKASDAIKLLVEKVGQAIEEVGKKIVDKIVTVTKQIAENPKAIGEAILNTLIEGFNTIAAGVFSKYKMKLYGVMSSLTGYASGPWHITIGNPKKPLFSSGDMICSDVDLSFGNVLSFNDLPSTIKASFTLTNARPLGIQEIMERFNIGGGRTYTVTETFGEEKIKVPKVEPINKVPITPNPPEEVKTEKK